MDHDPLCPNKACTCEPDDYGHEFTCEYYCLCSVIRKVRIDQAQKSHDKIIEYARNQHRPHDIRIECQRCDITAAYRVAANIVKTP